MDIKVRPVALAIVAACVVFASRVSADTFTVTTTTDTGPGSLRQAITDANAHFGLDTIAFNIASAGVQTITLGFPGLPQITSPVVIDGYSQPGSSANTLVSGDNAVILIEISGAIVGGNPTEFRLRQGAAAAPFAGS